MRFFIESVAMIFAAVFDVIAAVNSRFQAYYATASISRAAR